MRLIIALILAAGMASAQTTVNITNSLIGPVTQNFSNTQVNVSQAVITGAVFNASVTNDIQNTINVTNTFNVGTVSVTNDIQNSVSVTNIVENIAVTVTNTTIVYSPTEFITLTHTSTPDSVRIYSGTNLATSVVAGANMDIYLAGGGGSGNITIEGVTTNVFDFVGQFPVTVSNIGNTIYFGQLGGGGTFIPAGNSNQVFNFVPATTQTFTVPSGVTQLYAYAWGAGGGGGSGASGGAGGYSFGYFSVTNGEVLSVVIGEGGFVSSTTTATSVSTNTANPWPNGGWGASRGTGRSGAGGAYTAILRGTNFLVVAGGGGGGVGGAASAAGGGGGGTSGQNGFLGTAIAAGGGGTQTAGGATGSTAIPLAITNTAGSFGVGGNAGLTTNATAAAVSGGGGGGWFGGGGGLTSVNGAAGGGGSGHINTDQGVLGTTVQAQTPSAGTNAAQPPPATDDPLYGSPTAATWGRGAGSNTAGSNGGMIIRWVQP